LDKKGHDKDNRVYTDLGKSPTILTHGGGDKHVKVLQTCELTTVQKDNYVTEDFVIRKLMPLECERLQTLPDDYTSGISNTQRYKALANGWTVDVIAHIFKSIAARTSRTAGNPE